MRRSQIFLKTRKEAPADEKASNAQLLIRAGYIHKDAAGVYALLPLGLKVVENIKQVVREEMNAIGGEELLMTTLQRKELWSKTERWDDKAVDIWFKTKLKNNSEVGLAWSHEEPISEMMSAFIASYRDLPAYVYQFQTKLRNEPRAKSGILRSREFIMKDLYSFSRDAKEHEAYYQRVIAAYHKIFKRLGLDDITYLTFASGEPFTQFSHEFQTILPAGEDVIYLDKVKKTAINEEVMSDEVIKQLGLDKNKLAKTTAAEVGNIFNFGTAKSQKLGLTYTDERGAEKAVALGSYGIGITRLMGVMAEHFADDKGLVWPALVAPFDVYLARLSDKKTVVEAADKAYSLLTDSGVSVLYDDRSARPGEMFADADLIGLPQRVVVSEQTIKKDSFELKSRQDPKVHLFKLDELAGALHA
ncbi:prolyl-tRNA synthetase [Candidatus Saccharibacteria bacterium]|nr:prolyl-tRNA synthetase [Candidatus Saccharibacteria bacterium]